ncbi:MAG: 4-hydroxythreonine-4-phosphate dehydrogenase PdxA [Sulfitobacter sp.]
MQKKTIAVIQGDPAGIGPELLLKLLADEATRDRANLLVLGDPRVLEASKENCALELPEIRHIARVEDADFAQDVVHHLDLEFDGIAEVPLAQVSAAGGASSIGGLHRALELARDAIVDAIVFMPFNKESMHLGGNDFTDELGYARHFFQTPGRVSEFNVANGMWNGRVTSHVPMREVADLLTEERICESIELADNTLKMAGYDRPRIVVAAYNPHAGDGGLLGREEIEVIAPAVKRMQQKQMSVAGPLPADTLWLKVRDGDYDAVVTMYHDQGQIAIKLLGFDRGVSVLAGLPVPITTPAHGTAFDIAGQNKANAVPTLNAFIMALNMAERRPASEGVSGNTQAEAEA